MHPKLDTTLGLWYDILESGFSSFESYYRNLYVSGNGLCEFSRLQPLKKVVLYGLACYYIAMKTKHAAFAHR